MAKKLPKLPEQTFIAWEKGMNDKPFFNTSTNIEDVKCEGAEVGVYELKSIRRFELIEK